MAVENLFGDSYRSNTSGNITSNWQQIINNGILRQGSNFVENGTTALYTCPAKRVFYIISGMLQYLTLSTIMATTILNIGGGETLVLKSAGLDNDTLAVALSLAFPIILTAGQTIQIVSTAANIRAYGSFSGYEVPI